MPDVRRHRGPHPEDARLFGLDQLESLQAAVGDLNWLLTRGYAITSSLKLVGDRFGLDQRQRIAISRCAASDQAVERRRRHECQLADVRSAQLWIDGYNLLTTVEAALAGGVILVGRDGCYRDMASMHGSYRKVAETLPALEMIGATLQRAGAGTVRWLLDSPVSNSGRLKAIITNLAAQNGWNWAVELVTNPDPILARSEQIVVSADSAIIDACPRWLNLVRAVVGNDAWIVSLS